MSRTRNARRPRRRHAGLAGAVMAAACAPSLHAGGDGCAPQWDPDFGLPGAAGGIVFDFAAHDDGGGAGPRLYASGSFTTMGGGAAARVAVWDGAAWSALGGGLSNNECYTIAGFGGDLYAAGYFDSAAGVPGTAKLARWDGAAWHSVGAQLELFSNQLWHLLAWDDGSGEALYVAGNFQDAGGVEDASYICRWDGESFSALGAPIGGAVPLIVFVAETWDDGNGEAMYAGGRFLSIDGVPANRIARWDGASWSPLGGGLTGPGLSPSVMSIVAFDDGTGEQLYVAGQTFNSAGGVPVNRIARWDGRSWSAVGDGFADGIVWDLEAFDDGNGPALYAFGTFSASGPTPISGVAKWDGLAWQPAAGGGANGDTYAGLVFDDGSGTALYVGGAYTSIGGVSSNRVGRLHACPDERVEGDVTGDGTVDVDDLVQVILDWGQCPDPPAACPADLNGDDRVTVDDLVLVILNWS